MVAFLAVGCASGVKRGSEAATSAAERPANNQVASVSVMLTDGAKSKVADNLKFNPDELLNHVKRALDGSSLINTGVSHTSMEIQIKDFRVRSNFSAVMWGFMAGADSVTADVVLKDQAGREFDRFEVSASYALGGLGGGQDETRMSWLYEKFAEETVKEMSKK